MYLKKIAFFLIIITIFIGCSKTHQNFPIVSSDGFPNIFSQKDSAGNMYNYSLNNSGNLSMTIVPVNASDSFVYVYSGVDSITGSLKYHVLPTIFPIDTLNKLSYTTLSTRIVYDMNIHPANDILTNVDFNAKKVYQKTFTEAGKQDSGYNIYSVKPWYNNTLLVREGTFDELVNDSTKVNQGTTIKVYNIDFSGQYSAKADTTNIFYPGALYIPVSFQDYIGNFAYGKFARTMVVASPDLIANKGQKWNVDLNKLNNLKDSSVTINAYKLQGNTLNVQYAYHLLDTINGQPKDSLVNTQGNWDINSGSKL